MQEAGRTLPLSPRDRSSASPSSDEEIDICMPIFVKPDRPKALPTHRPLKHSKTLGELGSGHIRSVRNHSSSVTSPLSPLSPTPNSDARTPTPNDLQEGVSKAFGQRLRTGEKKQVLTRPARLPSADISKTPGLLNKSRRNSMDSALGRQWKQQKPGRVGAFATGVKEVQRSNQPRPLSLQEDDIQVFTIGSVQNNRTRPQVKCNTFFPEAVSDDSHKQPVQRCLSPSGPESSTLPCIVPRGAMSAFRSAPSQPMPTVGARPFSTTSTLQPGFTVLFDGLSELPPEQILLEVEKVLQSLQAEKTDYCGNYTLQCTWQDVALDISIIEHSSGACGVHFAQSSCVSSVQPRFRRVCQQIMDALRVAAR